MAKSKKIKIPGSEDVAKLVANYPWISQRRWAEFFGVSSATFNSWLNKNLGIPEDSLRVIRLLNSVEEKKREAVTKLLSNARISEFIVFLTSLEHLAMKSDWLKFFGESFGKVFEETMAKGSVVFDLLDSLRKKDSDK